MQSASRKASKPFGTPGKVPANQAERRPDIGCAPDEGAGSGSGVMIDPLHPMHRDLLARFAVPPVIRRDPWDDTDRLPRPVRMAVIFYAAVGAWGTLCLTVEAVGTAL